MWTLVKQLLGFCIIAASVVIGFVYFAPDLWRDIALRNSTMVPHATARIDKASCKGFVFVLKSCTVTFHLDADARDRNAAKPQVAPPSQTLSYLFVGSPGERRVGLWRATERPGSVTSDLGMEYLTSRILTFIGMTLLSMVILISTAFYIASRFRQRNEDGPADDARHAEEAIAQHFQAGATSPAWQGAAASPRTAQPAVRSRFGQRAPAR